MAAPTQNLEVWASSDVVLPASGEQNKIRPIDDLWKKGWDLGEKPSAEEFNYIINMITEWLKYYSDEYFPTIPTTYLPKNGTKITFSGDLTGNVTFAGNQTVTSNIQVVDNSHNHTSANISDATSAYSVNNLVKRGASGEVTFGDVVAKATTASDSATYFFQDLQGAIIGDISTTQGDSGILYLRKLNRANGASLAGIALRSDGTIEINGPRSSNPQEGVANALVRYDFLVSQLGNLSTSISTQNTNMTNYVNNLNTQMTNYVNGRTSLALGSSGGWWKDNNKGFMIQWGVFTGTDSDNAIDNVYFTTAFPNACTSVVFSTVTAASSLTRHPHIANYPNAQYVPVSHGSQERVFYWLATGY